MSFIDHRFCFHIDYNMLSKTHLCQNDVVHGFSVTVPTHRSTPWAFIRNTCPFIIKTLLPFSSEKPNTRPGQCYGQISLVSRDFPPN